MSIAHLIVIINFLTISEDEYNESGNFNTVSHCRMEKTLGLYGHDMISFK